MKIIPLLLTAVLLSSAVSPAQAASGADAAAGRELVKRYADAVVGVELVVTMKGTQGDKPLPPREQKREINGTMISAGGLVVLSLGDIDLRNSLPPQLAQQVRFDEPEFKEVKIRLTDNTEIPARVVMKDADLDLAFVAPVGPAPAGLAWIDLTNTAEPEVLGTYYAIGRGTKALQRVPTVQRQEVVGIVEKPRSFYLMNTYAISCPSFDATGKVLGIMVRHMSGERATGLITLPAASVAEIAQGAAAAAAKQEPAAETPAAAPAGG
jgi:S1-C subfamily serine protease